MEAVEALKVKETSAVGGSILSSDPNERRRALKDIFFRLPAKPAIRFIYSYIIRRGFLDGRAGFTYAVLLAMYEFMISCKVVELKRRAKGMPI
jgi:hypothetical protein